MACSIRVSYAFHSGMGTCRCSRRSGMHHFLGMGLAAVAAVSSLACSGAGEDGPAVDTEDTAELAEARQAVVTTPPRANFREHSVGLWPNYYFDGRPQP